MTREKAIEWYEIIMEDMAESDLKEALQMGLEALKAQEPEMECEACMIHYPEDNES